MKLAEVWLVLGALANITTFFHGDRCLKLCNFRMCPFAQVNSCILLKSDLCVLCGVWLKSNFAQNEHGLDLVLNLGAQLIWKLWNGFVEIGCFNLVFLQSYNLNLKPLAKVYKRKNQDKLLGYYPGIKNIKIHLEGLISLKKFNDIKNWC